MIFSADNNDRIINCQDKTDEYYEDVCLIAAVKLIQSKYENFAY